MAVSSVTADFAMAFDIEVEGKEGVEPTRSHKRRLSDVIRLAPDRKRIGGLGTKYVVGIFRETIIDRRTRDKAHRVGINRNMIRPKKKSKHRTLIVFYTTSRAMHPSEVYVYCTRLHITTDIEGVTQLFYRFLDRKLSVGRSGGDGTC